MRWDRDGFVNILLQNVEPGAEKNFNTKSTDAYSTHGTPFDYDSVMHHAVLNGNKYVETCKNILGKWQGPAEYCRKLFVVVNKK